MEEDDLELCILDLALDRQERKKPMTATAIERLRKRAKRFLAAGYSDADMQEMFDKAITSGWLSIYPPKKEARHASHVYKPLPELPVANREFAASNIAVLKQKARGVA